MQIISDNLTMITNMNNIIFYTSVAHREKNVICPSLSFACNWETSYNIVYIIEFMNDYIFSYYTIVKDTS